MSTHKESSPENNVWFGVAMFLMGLIAGVVLTFTSGSGVLGKLGVAAPSAQNTTGGDGAQPTAQVPKADVNVRMVAYAKEAGVDEDAFTTCVGSNKYEAKVNQQMSEGQAAGVNGTPGNIIYDMKSKKGILVSGAQPVASFQTVIDAMLKDPADAMAQAGVELAKDVTPVDLKADHVRGDLNAKIAIIEYSDYECPFCHRVHPTYQQLMEQYDGKILWVFRHFPLGFHQEAMPLAVGAECARELGGIDAFWEFTDKVMAE